jgi:hypothetical protein
VLARVLKILVKLLVFNTRRAGDDRGYGCMGGYVLSVYVDGYVLSV